MLRLKKRKDFCNKNYRLQKYLNAKNFYLKKIKIPLHTYTISYVILERTLMYVQSVTPLFHMCWFFQLSNLSTKDTQIWKRKYYTKIKAN